MRFISLLLTLSFFAFSTACESAEVKTVRVGVCLSQTGAFSESGRKAIAGVRLRFDEFNRHAERTGYRVEMVLRDDKSDAATAEGVVRELAVGERVPAIIGPLSTNLMMGMRAAAAEHKVVLISPSVTSPKIGHNRDWAIRVLFDDEFQGVALARFLTRKLGVKRAAAIINDRLAYSGSVFGSFKENMDKEGGEIVCEEHYSWVADDARGYDFTEILRRVEAAEPDIVVLPVNSADVISIVSQATRLGGVSRFCGGDTWQHESVLVSSGNNLEDSYFISGINYDSGTAEMERFISLFDNSNDPDAQLSSVLGYDAASLFIEGLLRGGADGGAIRDALYTVRNFELATGTITIDPERGSEKTAFIHHITREGGGFVSKIIDSIEP